MAKAVAMDANSKGSEKSTKPNERDRDFLNHLETYLAKRDGVDKLLKISRYASKIILASSVLSENVTLNRRLKSFESSVGLSRKAFRLGKFVQDVNALRSSRWDSNHEVLFSIVAYGGEGLYYFVEQFIWLSKSGLIDARHARWLQGISAWAEFVGYIGSISMKIRDLRTIREEEACLASTMEISVTRGVSCRAEEEKMKKVREKKTMKALSILQDLADALMAIADIRDGKGRLSAPMVISSAGMLSAIISTHKNWVSC
ncbi:PREDICTED: peroxisomal membrane protein 11A isoform X2 [Tarenaya hassleriana]|uniref:peroxisomal membrane protein 11A isoform X1 n=1 Tax=Tarenaya hassleriana TaxID=28532 RepID=UPI00053C7C83|nr:PREDICTED: peroxisomal membrane protein 11A isoform X1 [Tarenaya hassleriana]XP_010543083.1 PREDICTED: peroxisomal membrane protein 11A isoform X2 [Tarenaya hassleriana]XP_010543085.1 PREDICTED: peroxisomal membrane protein 11A isoform X2 [Tarenaya hassleriana]